MTIIRVGLWRSRLLYVEFSFDWQSQSRYRGGSVSVTARPPHVMLVSARMRNSTRWRLTAWELKYVEACDAAAGGERWPPLPEHAAAAAPPPATERVYPGLLEAFGWRDVRQCQSRRATADHRARDHSSSSRITPETCKWNCFRSSARQTGFHQSAEHEGGDRGGPDVFSSTVPNQFTVGTTRATVSPQDIGPRDGFPRGIRSGLRSDVSSVCVDIIVEPLLSVSLCDPVLVRGEASALPLGT